MLHSRALAIALAVGSALALGAPAGAIERQAPTTQLGQGPREPVIVLLRDQHPDRGSTTQAEQRPLVQQARRTGATRVTQFSVVNGFAATVTTAERDHLAADPKVAEVLPDLPVRLAGDPVERTAQATPAAPAGPTPKANPAVCPADPNHPLLEPEALQVTHDADGDPSVPSAQRLVTGKGVKVAYLADGIDTNNPDFVRADGSHVFVDYRDFSGEGTDTAGDDREAFGDASAIAAQGRRSYDLSGFVSAANPLPPGCDIRILGMAPGASLVGLKVVASNGFGSTSGVVQAIDYAVNVDHVNVINESLGANPYPDTGNDPFSMANDAAVAAGVTVVTSSGDAGYGNTVGSPASDPNVISTGASTTYRIMAQTWDGLPGFRGTWTSDNVSAISSSGITQSGRVYDLMAPGDLGWALCSADARTHLGCVNFRGKPSPVQAFGGTSEAAPLTAGAAALVMQAYALTHGGVKPAPALVKRILTSTATDENDPAERQGAGLLDALAAVRAAMSVQDQDGTPQPRGDGLLFGQSQLDATGDPTSVHQFDLAVTNAGATDQTVTGHGRVLGETLSDQRGSVTFDTGRQSTLAGRGGAPDSYARRTFTVDPGADHLDASIAWSDPDGEPVTVVLLDPDGSFAGYSLPQAAAGPDFGHVDVHDPRPGTWTALIYRPRTAAAFTGPVAYRFTTRRNVDFGSVFGTLHLAPGETGTLHVVARNPVLPGDTAAAVEVDTAAHQRFAVPLVLRTLVGRTGRFAGVLTGGNGRPGAAAQTNTFAFDVPPSRRDVDVSVTLRDKVPQVVLGYLVSPDGQILSQATNVLTVDGDGNPTAFGRSLQGYRRDPVPGRWRYVVVFGNPVAGATTNEPFTGRVRYDRVDVTADGVPGGLVPAGKPVTVTVRVDNTGSAVGSYYVDARTANRVDARLVADGQASDVPLQPSAGLGYLVPPETTTVTGSTSGSVPVTADLAPNTGEPEHLAPPGPTNVAVASTSSPAVTPGLWLLEADPVGPFSGSRPGTADFTVVAHTRAFDPAVTSSTGDFWLRSVQARPPAFHPVRVRPGDTGTITVTFVPRGAPGTVVRGWLYVDDTTLVNDAGDELAAVPYTYVVG